MVYTCFSFCVRGNGFEEWTMFSSISTLWRGVVWCILFIPGVFSICALESTVFLLKYFKFQLISKRNSLLILLSRLLQAEDVLWWCLDRWSLFQFPCTAFVSFFSFMCLEAWYKLNNNHSRLVFTIERGVYSHCFVVKLFDSPFASLNINILSEVMSLCHVIYSFVA